MIVSKISKKKIDYELKWNSIDIDKSKYDIDLDFKISNFEDIMLFVVKSNNINFKNKLLQISCVEDKMIEKINKDIQHQISLHILKFAYRTLIYELNLLRERGHFKSKDSSEQFYEYLELFNNKNFRRKFIIEYSNLIYLLEENLEQITTYINNFLSQLKSDESTLLHFVDTSYYSKFKLKAINIGLGDTHNNGESVVKCNFDIINIYFKPRDCNIDLLYNSIIDEVNKHQQLDLQKPTMLQRNDCFWVAEIKNIECKNEKEIKNFYYELGAHLSLLYVLGATDFHSENLIASGKHPVLVDLESVVGNKLKEDSFSSATFFNVYKLASSVKTTGILPFAFGNNDGSNLSGIGMSGGESPVKVPVVKNKLTSYMRVDSDFISMKSSQNHPKIEGKNINEKLYKNELIDGFKKTYDFIMLNKDLFFEIINKRKNVIKARFINNATMHYSRILNLSFHPIVLKSVTLRKLFISYYIYDPFDKLTELEIENLIHMNIPYFYYYGNGKKIYNQNKSISNYFFYTLEESILYKLNNLSEKDKLWQVRIISDSLRSDEMNFIPHMSQNEIKDYRNFHIHKENSIIEKFNNLIFSIEDLISSKQVEIDNTYSWIVKDLYGKLGNRTIEREVMDPNLYRGLSGMALYYWALYKYTSDKSYLEKSKKITIQIQKELDAFNDYPLGAFDGIYSYIYLCSNIYIDTNDKYFIVEAMKYIRDSFDKIKKDSLNDFISGNAGVLVILINLYSNITDNVYKEDILKGIELSVARLIENANIEENNLINWKSEEDDVLLGFAHGTSGIAYALDLYLSKIKYVDEIFDLVKSANMFEEMYRIKNHWPHPHSRDSKPPFAWCHGSPGIILNREKSNYFKNNDRKIIISEILKIGFSRTHCLCHGDLGNAMILKDISNSGKENEQIQNIIFEILKDINVDNLKCGIGHDIETVDFLTGISGISYGLMYILGTDIPNILRLEL